LSAWLAIDQPDTDFKVSIYEECVDASSMKLSTDLLRARYRQDARLPTLITTHAPLRYEFANFTFIACQLQAGSRLY
jgi:predicted acyl esterase